MDEKKIRKDRLRYSKNKTSSSLALVAIVVNVFYFVSIYKSDVQSYYYTWLIGASIIYNLLFMLTVFLCSEGVKNYQIGYSVALIVVGALQFVRIFIIPAKAFAATVVINDIETTVMSVKQHSYVVALLIASGVLLIIAGIVGMIKSRTLTAYLKELESEN